MSKFQVLCPDGQMRHTHPFDTRAEAIHFMEWGHCCTTDHKIKEIAMPTPPEAICMICGTPKPDNEVELCAVCLQSEQDARIAKKETDWDAELDSSTDHYLLTIWPPSNPDEQFFGHYAGFSINCPSMKRAEEYLAQIRRTIRDFHEWDWQIDSN